MSLRVKLITAVTAILICSSLLVLTHVNLTAIARGVRQGPAGLFSKVKTEIEARRDCEQAWDRHWGENRLAPFSPHRCRTRCRVGQSDTICSWTLSIRL